MNKYKPGQYNWSLYKGFPWEGVPYYISVDRTPGVGSLCLYPGQIEAVRWLLNEVHEELRVENAPGSKITWDVLNLKEKLYTIVTTEL